MLEYRNGFYRCKITKENLTTEFSYMPNPEASESRRLSDLREFQRLTAEYTKMLFNLQQLPPGNVERDTGLLGTRVRQSIRTRAINPVDFCFACDNGWKTFETICSNFEERANYRVNREKTKVSIDRLLQSGGNQIARRGGVASLKLETRVFQGKIHYKARKVRS